MLSRKFVINMVGVVVGLGLSICIGTIILLYQAMVDGQSRQMLEEAQGYSRLVYSMVRFGSLHTEKFKKDEMEAALTQLEAAQQETNSEGGLYSLARRQGDSILYLVRNNHGRISRNLRVPWDAPYAEPSRRGLSGQTGVVSWKDETGEPILAAYVAIPKLDAVMVVGVNLWVIRAPFVRAALLVAGGTAAGVGLALWVFLYSNRRYLQKVAREESSNRAVGDTSADGVIFINEQGRVLSCNPSAITIFGYSLRELVGNNVNMLMPEPYRSQHDGYLQKYRATGKASIIGVGRQVMGQRKDGTTFPAHLGVSEMWIGEERQFVGVLQDLTLQMVAEDEKNRYLRILGAVRRMQDQFISPHSRPREVFDEALLYLLDLTQSEYGFIGEVLHTPQGAPYLKIYALSNIAWNEDTRKFFDVNAPLGLEFHNLNTLFGHTLTTGQPVIANQPAGDPRSGGLPPGHPPMTAYLGIPFIQGGELVGMAGLANKPGGYSQDLLDYLTPMTGACANIVVAYHTQRQKERITEELRLNQEVLSRSQQVAKLGSWMRDMKTGRGVASGEFKKIVEMNGPGEDGEDFFQQVLNLVVPEDQEKLRELRKTSMETLTPAEGMFNLVTPGGTAKTVQFNVEFEKDEKGRPKILMGTIQDVTSLTRAQTGLARTERRFSALFTQTPLAVMEFSPDFTITEWNPAAERIFGFTREEALNKKPEGLIVSPKTIGEVAPVFQALLSGEGGGFSVNKNITKDGREIVCEWYNTSLLDESGNLVGVASIAQEISSRVENELALRDSEASMAKAQAIAHVGHWDWTIRTNGLKWTDEIYRIFGLKPQEFAPTYPAFLERVHPGDREVVEEGVRMALENIKPYHVEHRVVRPDGDVRVVLEQGEITRDEAGNPIRMVGTVHDVTEAKRVEAELQARAMQQSALAEMLRRVLEGAPLQTLIEEAVGFVARILGMESSHVLELNRDAKFLRKRAAIGWPPELGGGIPLGDNSQHPYQITLTTRDPVVVNDTSLETKVLVPEQMKFLGVKSGICVPILSSTGSFGVLGGYAKTEREYRADDVHFMESLAGILTAAVEKQRVESALRVSQERLRTVVTSAPIVLMGLDEKGRVVLANGSALDALGITPENAVGATLKSLFPEVPSLASAVERALGGEVITSEVDVGRFSFENRLTPIHGGYGEVTGVVVVWTDITERKRVERLKSEFVSTVSHELRTPLTSIRGSLGLVTGGVTGSLPPQAKSMLDIAYNNSERLVRLINDILDIEKIESGKMNFDRMPLSLTALVSQTLEANQGYAKEHGVTFRLHPSPEELRVEGDGDRLTQVITNLLSNATKFSPQGGVVEITLGQKQTKTGKSLVRLEVRDHGPGIPPEFQPRIFQKFAQADSSDTRQKGGTGLGLNISQAIVEHHGGRIGFETHSGDGTTFFMELDEWRAADTPAEIQPTFTRPRVLVVDDDPDVAGWMTNLLNANGMDADKAGRAGLVKNKLLEHTYAALVLDISLPDMDGLSLLKELKEEGLLKDLPVVMVSAYLDSINRKEVQGAAQILEWIEKPISRDFFLEAITHAVEHSKGRMPQVLHVEDDGDIRVLVKTLLQGIAQVDSAETLAAAKRMVTYKDYHLLILDVGLPDGNGLDLMEVVKQQGKSEIPVVVFSARELDKSGQNKVAAVLVKSRTTNQQFVHAIQSVFHQPYPKDPQPIPEESNPIPSGKTAGTAQK